MSKIFFRVIFVLFTVSLACNFTGATNQQSQQATHEYLTPAIYEQMPTVEPPITPYNEGDSILPNLILYASNIKSEPLGNGLKRIAIYLYGMNASKGWFSYSLDDLFAQDKCLWGDIWANGGSATHPILRTKEGFEYEAVSDNNLSCGSRLTEYLPPGLVFTSFGESFTTAEPFGWIYFDIAEATTPDSVTLSYGCGKVSFFTECFDIQTTTIQLSDIFDGALPFDTTYSEHHHSPGDTIKIGEIASLVVLPPKIGSNNSLIIPVTINNLHQGYPLKFGFGTGLTLHLVNEHGVVCCETGTWKVGLNFMNTSIGPSQSLDVDFDFGDIIPGKYWLLGQIGLEQDSPTPVETSAMWVVKFDVLK